MKQKILILILILSIILILILGKLFSAFDFKLNTTDFQKNLVYAFNNDFNGIDLKDNKTYTNPEVLSSTNFENTYEFSVSTSSKKGEYVISLEDFKDNTYNDDNIMIYLEKNGKAVMNPTKVSELKDYKNNSKMLYKCLYGSKDGISTDEYSLKIWVSNDFYTNQNEYFYKLQVNVY